MTEEAQRIALAEACGWHSFRDIKGDDETRLWGMSRTMRQTSLPTELVPDYLHSLDAMHEAEKVLTNEQRRHYARMLVEIHPLKYDPCDPGPFCHDGGAMNLFLIATMSAAQRLEAILRTLNLWDDMK